MATTCVLIDDDTEEHDLFTAALQEVCPDMICEAIDSGTKAVNQLRDEQSPLPQFIFLDLNMPVMDGKQVLTLLKTINRIREVPIVVYSTSANSKDVHETKRLGSSGYIVKPNTFKELVTALGVVLLHSTKQKNTHFTYGRLY